MAAVLNFDRDEAPSRAAADAAMATVLAHVGSLPARIGVPRIAEYRRQLDAAEVASLATVVGADGNTKSAERVAAKDNKTSKRSQRRAAKRAAAVKKNPNLAKKMADGDLSGEHVDVLADAASRTNGDSLHDPDLIDAVAGSNPDKGKSIIDDYLVNKNDNAGTQRRHDRQRAKRRIARFRTKDDCEALLIAGDKATIDRIYNETVRRANQLYRQDGGRDIPLGSHPRTNDQRRFDAIVSELFTNQPGEASTGQNQAKAAHPSNWTPTDQTNKTSSKRVTKRKGAGSGKQPRPVIVVTATLEKFAGMNPRQVAELIGSGPIADSVLAEYVAADPDIVGAIFNTNGQPLWLGRKARLATDAQHLALILRDKGCVLCGAHHTHCKAHHIQPWTAPEPGPTNINNLVLVCESCHTSLHEQQQTIYHDRHTRQWALRPALPHETPPPRPPQPARGHAPQRV